MKMDKKMKGHVKTPLINWCNRIIQLGFYLLFALVPLLLTPYNYELFEFNKMIGVYIVTTLIVTSWIIKMILQKEIRISRTPLDIPIALFVTSQLVSSIFSIDPHVSWFGYYSRFNGGMWSVISYVVLYYAYVSNPPDGPLRQSSSEASEASKTNWTNETNLLKATLISGSLVALYGVLERMGIDKDLWVQDVQNRVFSTLGQPNWLAAYLVALLPLAMAFTMQSMLNAKWPMLNNSKNGGIKNLLFSIYHLALVILLFTTLLFTRSRSGLMGLVIADVVFWGLILFINFIRPPLADRGPSFAKASNGRSKGEAFFTLHILFALIIFINGTGTPAIDRYVTFSGLQKIITQTKEEVAPNVKPAGLPAQAGPALEVGGTESGTIRKYVWQGAINAWKSSPKTILFGTGTETFAFAFYQFRPAGHNLTSEWDFLYNKAHNEYLNYLATTGIFGLGSYLLFIGTFIYWFSKKILNSNYLISKQAPSSKSQQDTKILHIALFAGWISILVTNFFGFSVVIMQIFLFIFPILIISSTLQNTNTKEYILRINSAPWMSYITLTIGILLLYVIGNYWYADTLFASGYRYNRSGLYTKALPFLSSSVKASPYEPSYHDELAQTYAGLAADAFENKNATDAARLSTLAIRESDKALSTSPKNVNFYKTRTKVLYTLSVLNAEYNNDAVKSLQKAITLSPNDPKIYYNLAILLGRQDESSEAITNLLVAKNLKINYRDVYYALHVFYLEAKKSADAAEILTEYLSTVDPSDADFQERLK